MSKTSKLLQTYIDACNVIPTWDTLRVERAEDIIPIVLEHVEGDILEIGAHIGSSTNVFCSHAAKYDRNVYVVDPWDGRQQGNHAVFEKFKNNTAHHTNLIVQRTGSENKAVLAKFKKDNIRFAFILIDGLHSYDAVAQDINNFKDLLLPDGVICIDDWCGPYGFSKHIRKAAQDHLDDNYQLLQSPASFIERYFIKLA